MRDWLTTLGRTLRQGLASADLSLAAAGCALYAMLALFPALTLLVTVFGAALDPGALEPHLATLSDLLPDDAYALIAARLADLAAAPRPAFGSEAAIALGIALWSGSAGIRALLSALTSLRGVPETRGLVAFYGTALVLTLLGVLALAVAIAALVVLLPVLPLAGVPPEVVSAIRRGTVVPASLFVCLVVAVLYRYGPAGPRTPWRVVLPGAVLATLLWAGASWLFSLYAERWADYDRLYGSLGAAMALAMWFYVGAYALLLGMAWNVERSRA